MGKRALRGFVAAIGLWMLAALVPGTAVAMVGSAAPAALPAAAVERNVVNVAGCYRKGWRGYAFYSTCEKRVSRKRYKGMHSKKK